MKQFFLSVLLLFFIVPIFGQMSDAELITRTTDIAISNGKLVKNEFFEIKINNRAGERHAKVKIPFSKLHKLDKIEAFIKDSKGNIVRKLKNNEITERSDVAAFSLYEDDYVKEFTLKHNQFPYYICYSYQVKEDEFIVIENWIPVLDGETPTQHAELNLTIPQDYSIRFQNQFVDEPKIDSIKKTVTYHWSANYHQKYKPESFAPFIYNFIPKVEIIANDFKYVKKGSFRNWNDYVQWSFQLIQNINTLTEGEKSKISNLISGIKNNEDKVRSLYHYLQDNTRYINVSIKYGGVVPYPASYVCENKYGDCKALSNYFKSVLEFAGIKSYYSYVYAGDVIPKINPEFPIDKFNHIILFVPLESDSIWLDCTSKGPFNYLGTFTQNRNALIIDDVKGGLIFTPKLTPEDVLETRNVVVEFKENNPTKISFENTYKGKMFERLTQLETYYSAKDKDDILRNYFVPGNLDLRNYNVIKNNRDDKYIKLICETTATDIYKKYGDEIVINNIAFDVPNIERPENRKLPLQIDYPINKSDTVEYDFPKGYALSGISKDVSITELPYGTYSLKFLVQENKVRVVKSMTINSGNYPLSDYPKFYDFVNIILNLEKGSHIIFKPQN